MDKRFSKVFALLACLVMLSCVFGVVGASASDTVGTVVVKTDKISAGWGSEFTTTVYAEEGSNMAGITMTLSWDKNIVSLVSATAKVGIVNAGEDSLIFTYADTTNAVDRLDLIALTFKVDDQIGAGLNSNWLKKVESVEVEDECYTADGEYFNALTVSAEFGDIFVRHVGDAYDNKGDGKINARDASRVLQHVARIATIADNELPFANAYEDYNADGSPKINARDASVILQYVARIRDTLGNRKSVIFYDEDGNTYFTRSVKSGDSVEKIPSVPEKTDMAGKWSLSKDSYVEPDLSAVDGDIALYPYYEETATRYTVSFDLGGASGSIDAVKVVEGESFSAPSLSGVTPKTGYSFVSWVDESGAEYDFSTPVVKDMTLTATWTNVYTLKYRSFAGASWKTRTYTYGATVAKVSNPTRTGYTFTGWDQAFPTTMPAENLEITGTWSINQYTLTIVYGNEQANKVITQDYKTAIESIPNPVRAGYTFAGWSATIPTTMPAKNTTITANWNAIEYTLKYRSYVGASWTTLIYAYGDTVAGVADPTRIGYTFTGWDQEFPATMPAENLEITGTWSINQYTLTIVYGNGQANKVITQDYASTIESIPNPVRDGYVFAGWDKEIPTTMPAENTTITATWNEISSEPSVITVDWNYSRVANITITTDENHMAVEPTVNMLAFTPANAVFDGFYDENGVEIDWGSPIYEDITVHARWIDNGYFDGKEIVYKSTSGQSYSTSIGSSSCVDLSDGGEIVMTFDVLSGLTYANFQTKVSALAWLPYNQSGSNYNNNWSGTYHIGLAGNPAYTSSSANHYGYDSGNYPAGSQQDFVFGSNPADPDLVMTTGSTVKIVFTAPTSEKTGSIVYYTKSSLADDTEYVESCSMRNIHISDMYTTKNVYLWFDFYNCSAGGGASMTFTNFKISHDGYELPVELFNHYDTDLSLKDKYVADTNKIYEFGVESKKVGWLMSKTATSTTSGGKLFLEMDVLESNLAGQNANFGISLFNYLGVSNAAASGFHDSAWVSNPCYTGTQDGLSSWKSEDVSNKNDPTMTKFPVEEIWASGNSVRIVYDMPTTSKDGSMIVYTKPIDAGESAWVQIASAVDIKKDMVVDSGSVIMMGLHIYSGSNETITLKVTNLRSYNRLQDIEIVSQHSLFFREWYDETEDIFEMEGNTITGLTDIGKTLGVLDIPANYKGVEVTAIGDRAFVGSELQSVNIPATVTTIGNSAFRGIDTLDAVTFANGSNLRIIGDSAFRDCSSLSIISLPSGVTSVGELALYNTAQTAYSKLYNLNVQDKKYYAPKYTYEFMGEDVMPIGGYIEPSVGYLSVSLEEAIKNFTDTGTNMMIGIGQARYGTTDAHYEQMLRYLEQNGAMMLMKGATGSLSNYTGTWASMNQTLRDVRTYRINKFASYAGAHVADEPGISSWIPGVLEYSQYEPNAGAIDYRMDTAHLAWSDHYNRKLYYVNLLPINSPVKAFAWGAENYNYAPNTDNLWADYEQYANPDYYYETYIKYVKPEVFSYDFYPLWANGTSNAHLSYPNLNGRHFEQLYKTYYYTNDYAVQELGRQIPFWNFIQVTSWGNQYSGSRSATYNEILWQINTAFAFGSKGYQYFIFNDYGDITGNGASSGYGNCPINIDGTPGPSYYDVSSANLQSQSMAKWLLNASVDHISQYGSNPNGETINSYMKSAKDSSMSWSLSYTSGKNHLVSYMKYYENNNDYDESVEGDVRELYFVCNNATQTSNNGNITLRFKKSVSGSYIYNGEEYTFSGTSLTVPNTVAGSGFAVLLDK